MDNIFEGAKFGYKFKLVKSIGVLVGDHRLYIKGYGEEFYNDKGIALVNNEQIKGMYDIVSRYQEPIDEEKLNELALDWDGWDDNSNENEWSYTCEDIHNAYKAGYRKAKEE